MKITLKTGFTAIVLLLAISCKKENSNIKSLPANDNSSTEALSTDIDRPARDTIRIGTQVWRSVNLNLSTYRNGDKMPHVTDPAAWAALTTGAWCYYNNDPATGAIYGKLYNWYAVNDPRGLAPIGWHVPSNAEWTTLITFLGGKEVAGGKMKSTGTLEAGTGLWYAANVGATNRSGFTGLPGGLCGNYGTSIYLGVNGYWWSSLETSGNSAYAQRLADFSAAIIPSPWEYKTMGFSVRCVRD